MILFALLKALALKRSLVITEFSKTVIWRMFMIILKKMMMMTMMMMNYSMVLKIVTPLLSISHETKNSIGSCGSYGDSVKRTAWPTLPRVSATCSKGAQQTSKMQRCAKFMAASLCCLCGKFLVQQK